MPEVMIHGHVPSLHQDLEKAGMVLGPVVTHQRSARVQAELVRDRPRAEGPRGVDVSATIEMRTNRVQPGNQARSVHDRLAREPRLVLGGSGDRVMTGDEQIHRFCRYRLRGGDQLGGGDQLPFGQPAPGRDAGAGGIKAEDRGLGAERPQPRIRALRRRRRRSSARIGSCGEPRSV